MTDDGTQTKDALNRPTPGKDEKEKSSVDKLKKTVPSRDISIDKSMESNSAEKIEKIHETSASVEHVYRGKIVDSKEETQITEKPSKDEAAAPKPAERSASASSEAPSKSGDRKEPRRSPTTVAEPAAGLDKKQRVGSERIVRNQSDIFSLKEQTSVTTSIFSVNGSPSRKIYRQREISPSNVFPFDQPHNDEKTQAPARVRDPKEYCELKRPSSSLRNPLTGSGLSSNDEYKFKGNKKRDGNPLLGSGYSPEQRSSAHRIPPGGYSHKLW